jgi:hypothetical protein
MKGFFPVALFLAILIGGCTPTKNTYETSHQEGGTCQTCDGDGFVKEWIACSHSQLLNFSFQSVSESPIPIPAPSLLYHCEGGNLVHRINGEPEITIVGMCPNCRGLGKLLKRVPCPNNTCKNGQVPKL